MAMSVAVAPVRPRGRGSGLGPQLCKRRCPANTRGHEQGTPWGGVDHTKARRTGGGQGQAQGGPGAGKPRSGRQVTLSPSFSPGGTLPSLDHSAPPPVRWKRVEWATVTWVTGPDQGTTGGVRCKMKMQAPCLKVKNLKVAEH